MARKPRLSLLALVPPSPTSGVPSVSWQSKVGRPLPAVSSSRQWIAPSRWRSTSGSWLGGQSATAAILLKSSSGGRLEACA
eukprot:14195045-Alexandrium_andersonii.AAC.1